MSKLKKCSVVREYRVFSFRTMGHSSIQRNSKTFRNLGDSSMSHCPRNILSQTVKTILNKCDDEYLALLTYRNTPHQNGYSPAQLNMGRKLKTRVSIHPDELIPKLPDSTIARKMERQYRDMMAQTYNRRHRVVEGETIAPGDRVWVPDLKTHGKVVRNLQQPRSVLIETTRSCVRRNRRMIRRLDLPNLCQPTSNRGQDVMTETQLTSLQPDGMLEVDDHEHPPVIGHYDEQSVPEPSVSVKSGRATRKPTRYIEEC